MGVLPDWHIERDIKITPFAPQQKRPGVISYGVTSYGYDVRLGYVGKIFTPIGATVIDPKAFDPNALVTIDLSPPEHKWSEQRGDGEWECEACGVFSRDKYNHPSKCSGQKPDHFLIPPHSFMLGVSVEEFDIPRDVLVVVVGKSTYARCGLVVNVTPGEPEWQGYWTIELSNTTPLPIKVYAGEGIMQALFFRSDALSETYRTAVYDYIHGKMPVFVREQMDVALGDSVRRHKDEDVPSNIPWTVSCRTSYADKKGRYQAQSGLTLPFVETETK